MTLAKLGAVAANAALEAVQQIAKTAASGASDASGTASIPASSLAERAAAASMHGAARLGRKLYDEYGKNGKSAVELAAALGTQAFSHAVNPPTNGARGAPAAGSGAAGMPAPVMNATRSDDPRKIATTLGEQAFGHLLNRQANGSGQPAAADGKAPDHPATATDALRRAGDGRQANKLRNAFLSNGARPGKRAPAAAGGPDAVPDRFGGMSPQALVQELGGRLSKVAELCGADLNANPVLSAAMNDLKSDAPIDEAKLKERLSTVVEYLESVGLKKLEDRIAETTDTAQRREFIDKYRQVLEGLHDLRENLGLPPRHAEPEPERLSPEQEKLAQKTHEQLLKAEFEELCRTLIDAQRILSELVRKGRRNAEHLV